MNCGIFTSVGLLLLAMLGYLGMNQQAVMVEPLPPSDSVTVEVVPVVPQGQLCAYYPDYCVPLAGQSAQYEMLEAGSVRELDAPSSGVAGVVRYVGHLQEPRIGNPDAPIHFITVSDYACPHCQTFHVGDLALFIEDYVLTGQATFGVALTTGTGGELSVLASQAALCAGEQGAFWEYSQELLNAAASASVYSVFSMDSLHDQAQNLGLDAAILDECVTSGRYESVLSEYDQFALDSGVLGTPTVLVNYGDGTWEIVDRSYENLATLTEAANAQ